MGHGQSTESGPEDRDLEPLHAVGHRSSGSVAVSWSRLARAPESTSSTTHTIRVGDHGQAHPGHLDPARRATEVERAEPVEGGVQVGDDRDSSTPAPAGPDVEPLGSADRSQVDQLDDAGVGSGRVTEEHGPQRGCRGPEEGRPVTRERLVHEHGEPQAITPEAQAGLDVLDADGRVVDHRHDAVSGRNTIKGGRMGGSIDFPCGTVAGERSNHAGHVEGAGETAPEQSKVPGVGVQVTRESGMTAPRTAVVVGGGSGIGAAVAERYRAAQIEVVVWDRTGGDLVCDITAPDQVEAATTATIARFGVPGRGHRHRGRGGHACSWHVTRRRGTGSWRQRQGGLAGHAVLGRTHGEAGRRIDRGHQQRERPAGRPDHGPLLRLQGGPRHGDQGGRR